MKQPVNDFDRLTSLGAPPLGDLVILFGDGLIGWLSFSWGLVISGIGCIIRRRSRRDPNFKSLNWSRTNCKN